MGASIGLTPVPEPVLSRWREPRSTGWPSEVCSTIRMLCSTLVISPAGFHQTPMAGCAVSGLPVAW